ncbi:MAG: hypothetical protein J1F61_06870, partial [Clostridiales bacterium]|nr:hypothetical protein [Clostridiales bacterium]
KEPSARSERGCGVLARHQSLKKDAFLNSPEISPGCFLYSENPAIVAGFSKGYAGEKKKKLLM